MARSTTAREAVIAEALGDMTQLLDRLELVLPALDKARLDLTDLLATFEGQMVHLTERAKLTTAEYIARRTNEAAAHSTGQQVQAMTESARAIFRTELEATLRRLALNLRKSVHQGDPRWPQWTVHAATAVASCAGTWAVMSWYFRL